MKNKLQLTILTIIIAVGAYWLGAQSSKNTLPSSTAQQQFNPTLVAEKQKCQNELKKIQEETNDFRWNKRAYFNSNLNTCLIEEWTDPVGAKSATTKVIDAYKSQGFNTILEWYAEYSTSAAVTFESLTENGQIVKTNEPGKEYNKRRAVLFEESVSNY